jgi:hypothetical protein
MAPSIPELETQMLGSHLRVFNPRRGPLGTVPAFHDSSNGLDSRVLICPDGAIEFTMRRLASAD